MILDTARRPLELFDPSKKLHRQYYGEFLRTNSWSGCPIRFAVQDENSDNNLAFAMQRMLAEYYVSKEFKLDQKG